MLQNRISGLPVVGRKGELVGMVTEGDFLRRGEIGTQRHHNRWLEFLIGPGRLADEYVHARGRKVEEVMTREPITVSEDTPLDEAVRLMERHRIKRLPVVRAELSWSASSPAPISCMRLVSLAVETKAPVGDDATIREQILAECAKQSWAPMANVVVRNGVVELWGTITDERERRGLIVASENVPGVKTVHDHLVWIEPNSGFVMQSEEDEAREKAARSEASASSSALSLRAGRSGRKTKPPRIRLATRRSRLIFRLVSAPQSGNSGIDPEYDRGRDDDRDHDGVSRP